MRRALFDTSYVVAPALRTDEHHDAAVRCQKEYEGEPITTEYVLVEVHDALSQAALRPLAISVTDELMSDPNIAIVPASEGLFQRGRDLFLSRPDKDWGLTDCISFVVMQDRGIRDALTCDHHFTQAGFNVLMK